MAFLGIRKKHYAVLICSVVKAAMFVRGLRGGPIYMQRITHTRTYILSSTVPPSLFHARAQIDNDVFVFYI